MVTVRWSTERADGNERVALVELVLENAEATARRVRIGNRLDGAVRPPRREGVPEAGWDDGGFEGVVGAGERRSLGYACAADPVEPPVEVVWTERAAETGDPSDWSATNSDAETSVPAVESTVDGVIRALGDPRPPRDAVPPFSPSAPNEELPVPVSRWFASVEERVERREALARATCLTTAAAELDESGGLEGAESVVSRTRADRETLGTIIERAKDLRRRIESNDVPLSAFRRLA